MKIEKYIDSITNSGVDLCNLPKLTQQEIKNIEDDYIKMYLYCYMTIQ